MGFNAGPFLCACSIDKEKRGDGACIKEAFP